MPKTAPRPAMNRPKQVETYARFDAADYLTNDTRITAYLEAAMAEVQDDPQALVSALGAIARARNLTQLAREAGMSREGLHKALSPSGNPSFATMVKIARALGLKIGFTAA